jgi:multidrug efflux system outer membrane protein
MRASVFRIVIGGSAICALAHCTPSISRTKPDVALASTWEHADALRSSLRPTADLRQWWEAFADPVLDQTVERALRGNLDVQQAVYRLQAARALTRESRSEFRPQLSAKTYSTPSPDSRASYFQAGFDATWELGLFGRAQNQSRIAATTVALAEVDAQAGRVSLVAEVVRAYLQLRTDQARSALLMEIADAQRKKLQLMEVRYRLQLSSGLDLSGAQVERATADAQTAEPQLGIEQSYQQLMVLVGSSEPDPALRHAAGVPALHAPPLAGVPADLLRTRPEIQRAEQTVLRSAADLGVAKADLYPRLALGGLLIASARISGISLGVPHSTQAIGPVIDIPLFDWGARRAVVSAREADLNAAELAYRAAVLAGVSEVETALATLKLRRQQVDALRVSVQALQHANELTRALRSKELADDGDELTTRTTWLRARVDLLQAELVQNLAYVALYKALGGAPQPPQEATR